MNEIRTSDKTIMKIENLINYLYDLQQEVKKQQQDQEDPKHKKISDIVCTISKMI